MLFKKVYAEGAGTRLGNERNTGYERDDGGIAGMLPTTRAGARGAARAAARATGNAAGGNRTGRR